MVNAMRSGMLLLMSCAFGTAHAAKPYDVDDMLEVESVGGVRFDPSGKRLIYERYGPFDRQADFGQQDVIGELRSKILIVDLDGTGASSPLFPQDPASGYTISGLSPDGRRLIFRHASRTGARAGVVPLAGGAAREFDLSPTYSPIQSLSWIGQGVVFSAEPAGEAAAGGTAAAFAGLWSRRNRGDTPTAGVIGSGRFAVLPETSGGLVVADAGSMRTAPLASGRFSTWHASADGSIVAALREERLAIDPARRIEHGANMGGIQRRLLILDPRAGGAQKPDEPCTGCDVLASSLNWSASAPLLSFVARDEGRGWDTARYRIYDRRSGRASTVDLGALKPHAGRMGFALDMQSAWIGDRLAILAEPAGTPPGTPVRADWYLVGRGKPRNLTAAFGGAAPKLIGIGRDTLIVLHDGEAWAIDRTGKRRNLTAAVAEPVRPWRPVGPFGPVPEQNLQPSDCVTLRLAAGGAGKPERLIFVELASGLVDTVAASLPGGEFVAASPVGRRAALIERDRNTTLLSVVGADGSRREVAQLNRHLQNVVGGTPVRIDHKGPSGDARTSWILLPPGYRPGMPVATIVNVYPGSFFTGGTWSKWSLDDIHALNDHILAAHGYAVLYPSIPVDYDQLPRDPLKGLPEQIFAAIDAAVAQGYVDPDRLGVQGQSYGGYTTGALVGLTDRFKTAVAQAGIYDLVSSYGQFVIDLRLKAEKTGLDLFSTSLMETGQGGMGAPPWADPERYLRNSPLMHVEKIKTPIMLMTGDLDYVSTTQTEEFFTALTRLNKDAVMVRYYGEDHVYNSPANIRDMWRRILDWYDSTLGGPGAKSAAPAR